MREKEVFCIKGDATYLIKDPKDEKNMLQARADRVFSPSLNPFLRKKVGWRAKLIERTSAIIFAIKRKLSKEMFFNPGSSERILEGDVLIK